MAEAEVIEFGEPAWLLYAYLPDDFAQAAVFLESMAAGASAAGVQVRFLSEPRLSLICRFETQADAQTASEAGLPTITQDGRTIPWTFEIKRGIWHTPPEERLEDEIFDLLENASIEQLQKTRDFIKDLLGV